jgi:hypothetical protein
MSIWGKIAGAAAGLAPPGALLGAIAEHTRPRAARGRQPPPIVKNAPTALWRREKLLHHW